MSGKYLGYPEQLPDIAGREHYAFLAFKRHYIAEFGPAHGIYYELDREFEIWDAWQPPYKWNYTPVDGIRQFLLGKFDDWVP